MQVDVLVIGQGICGTWLSYFLDKNSLSYHVMDNGQLYNCSRIASGLINPVTGRRLVKTWMIDTLIEFSDHAYRAIGKELDTDLLSTCSVINFPPSVQMKMAFDNREKEQKDYLHAGDDDHKWHPLFHFDFGNYITDPCLLIDIRKLLDAWRERVKGLGHYTKETFEPDELELRNEGIRYGTITARYIVFCDGTSSFNNKWFRLLPFAPSKGEALWIQLPGLPQKTIFKKGYTLVPWAEDIFWVGSSYEWEFDDPGPTAAFRNHCEQQLKEWIRLPFDIIDHRAAIRPASLERRPFAGFHPQFPSIGILNGMGTKGCSLAPYFAGQLAENLRSGKPLLPEVDIRRFAKVLSRH